VIVSGNVTGIPTVGVAGDGVPTVIAAATLTFTVTDADEADVVGVVGVVGVPPVGGGVVVPPPVMPAVAVTVAVLLVVSVVWASPAESVATEDAASDPAFVLNVTGTPVSGLPLVSSTLATIVDVPPLAETVPGLALIETLPTAAAPTAILIALVPLALAPPELATIVAVPLAFPALNLTVTRPALVSASAG
jgi:hypothetical protein